MSVVTLDKLVHEIAATQAVFTVQARVAVVLCFQEERTPRALERRGGWRVGQSVHLALLTIVLKYPREKRLAVAGLSVAAQTKTLRCTIPLLWRRCGALTKGGSFRTPSLLLLQPYYKSVEKCKPSGCILEL